MFLSSLKVFELRIGDSEQAGRQFYWVVGYVRSGRLRRLALTLGCHRYDDGDVTQASAPYAGDPAHPDHPKYLTELGAAVYAAAGVAGVASDVLRVHLGEDTMDLVDDPLGVLIKKLEQHDKSGSTIPGLTDFIVQLNAMLPM